MKISWLGIALPTLLAALPTGPNVIQGDAQIFLGDSQKMRIDAGQKAMIEWDSFSIGAEELVHFLQPDAQSLVINRVLGSDPSALFGQIHANGQVWLINPSGIFVGPDALIDTGEFLASTLDWIEGNPFEGNSIAFVKKGEGIVEILGTIKSNGEVILLGPEVDVKGIIDAKGALSIGSGTKVLYEADKRIYVQLQQPDWLRESGIRISGNVHASEMDLISDGNLFKNAICIEGLLDASELYEEDGRIYLSGEKGTVLVKGELKARGGEIQIIGDQVGLIEQAKIDVSGGKGGSVLIGHSTRAIFMGKEASIRANAVNAGDGGSIILSSKESTQAYGFLSARGGSTSGNGGFIEVSGNFLAYDGIAEAGSAHGHAGRLLLDPTNILVQNAAMDNNVTGPPIFAPTGPAALVTPLSITTALATMDVIVQSSGSINTPGEQGDITVVDTVSYTSPQKLTLTTQVPGVTTGSIFINNVVTNMAGSTGSIEIFSQNDVVFNADVNTDGGNLTVQALSGSVTVQGQAGATVLVNTNTGILTITNVGQNVNVLAGPNAFEAAEISTFAGDLFIINVGGDLNVVAGPMDFADAVIDSPGNIAIAVAGDVFVGSGIGPGINCFARIDASSGPNNLNLACRDLTVISGGDNIGGRGGSINGPAEIISGSGTTRVAARNIAITGIASNPGSIDLLNQNARIGSNFGGDVSVAASGSITITGGDADLGGAFIGMPDEAGFAPGTVSVSSGGNLSIFGGAGFNSEAGIFTDTTPINVAVGGDLLVTAGSGTDSAALINTRTSGDIALAVLGNATFLGNGPGTLSQGSAAVSVGTSSTNALTVAIGQNLTIDTGPTNQGTVGLLASSSSITARVNGSLIMNALAISSNAYIVSGSFLNLIVGGNISEFSNVVGAQTAIFSQIGGTNVSAGSNITINITGTLGGIVSLGGNLMVTAGNSIFVEGTNGTFSQLGGAPGDITAIAGKNMTLLSPVSVNNAWPGGAVNLVVDNDFPTSPLFGKGAFFLGLGANVTTNNGALRVFTSQRTLNSILGNLNGQPFVPGPILVNSNTERWGVYYFNPFFGNEFYTIFYKTGKDELNFVALDVYIAAAELFRRLHPYNEYTRWAEHFVVAYESDIQEWYQDFFLRRRTHNQAEDIFSSNPEELPDAL